MFCFNGTATTEIYTYIHTLSLHDALPIFSVQRTNRSSIGDFVKSLPPDYRAPPHGLTLPVPAAMPPGGLQRKTCRPIQQRRHERHELVERAGVFRPLADDLVVAGENDRIACAQIGRASCRESVWPYV